MEKLIGQFEEEESLCQYIEVCKDHCVNGGIPSCHCKPIMEVRRKLFEYESTGLMPGEIPHWIPVSKRLPNADGTYIVYAPSYNGGSSSGLDCIGGIMFCRFKHGKWSIEHGYYNRPNCVTHWMPLPQPPKG